MTKSKFFATLECYLNNQNNYAKFENDFDKYTASQIEPYVFHEDLVKLAEYKAKDPSYPWVAHASGFTLAECWNVTLVHHKTAAAAEKQGKIFSRWVEEYKIANK